MSLTNLDVARAFVKQSIGGARSGNGNLWFSGSSLNSYRTTIAQLHTGAAGQKVVLATEHHYSATTEGKHMNALWKATDYGRNPLMFRVVSVAGSHRTNAAYLRGEFDLELARVARARIHKSLDHAKRLADRHDAYIVVFGLDLPHIHYTEGN